MVRWRPPVPPARTADVIAFLDELLEVERFADLGPNGLQVPGAAEVTTVLTGVSAQKQLFEQALAEGAQLVLAHHGILWDFEPRRIGPTQATRLKLLLANDVALAGYHLPLDAHPEHGNNALLAHAARRHPHTRAFPYKGQEIGVVAHFDDDRRPRRRAVRARRTRHPTRAARLRRRPTAYPHARESSPAPPPAASRRRSTSASTRFLTGEPKEHVMAQARESGIHFVAAGHYATETFGIRRIGELVAERFGVRHVFADIPNPV